jgi:hypothetical protein
VNKSIKAFKKFSDEFDKSIPVRCAFWLKINEGPFGR